MRTSKVVPQLFAIIITALIIVHVVRYFGKIDAVYLDDEVGYLAKATTLQEIPIRHPSKYHFGAGVFTVFAGKFVEFTAESMSQFFLVINICALIANLLICDVLLRKLGALDRTQRHIINFIAALGPASIPFIFSQFPNLLLQTFVLILCLIILNLPDAFFSLNAIHLFLVALIISALFSLSFLIHPSTYIIALGFLGAVIVHSFKMVRAQHLKIPGHFVKSISFVVLLAFGLFYGVKGSKHIISVSNNRLSNGYGTASDYSRVEDQIRTLAMAFDFPRSLYGTTGVLLAVVVCVGPSILNLIFKSNLNAEGSISPPNASFKVGSSSLAELFLVLTIGLFVAYGTTMVGSEPGLARADLYFYGRYVSSLFPAIVVFSFRFRPKHVGKFVSLLSILIVALYVGSRGFDNEWIIAPVNMVSFSPRVLLGAQDLPSYYLATLGLFLGFFLLTRFREFNLYFLSFSVLISLVSTTQWVQFRTESAKAYSATITDLEVIHEAYLGSEAFENGLPILFINRGGPDPDLYRALRSAGGRFEVDVISFAAPVETASYCDSPVLLVVSGVGTERFAEFVGFDVLYIDKYHRAAIGTANVEACGAIGSDVRSELKALEFSDFILEG